MSTLRYRLLAYMVLLAVGLTTAHAEPVRLATADSFLTPSTRSPQAQGASCISKGTQTFWER